MSLPMSSPTKQLIQKICYKQSASVDMTKRGFVSDNELFTVNLLLKPLRKKLREIILPATEDLRNRPCPKLTKQKQNLEEAAFHIGFETSKTRRRKRKANGLESKKRKNMDKLNLQDKSNIIIRDVVRLSQDKRCSKV